MCKRVMARAVVLMCVLVPGAVAGQTPVAAPTPSDGRDGWERLSLLAAAGPTVTGRGSVWSAAVGYSPASRVELLLNVERLHQPFRLTRFPNGFSASRGGTATYVGGEVRLALRPPDRVSPFALVGVAGGSSRPTVNATFPDPVSNDLAVLYVGAGIRVPLRGGLSLVGDARAMLAFEGADGVMVWPVRTGMAWRF